MRASAELLKWCMECVHICLCMWQGDKLNGSLSRAGHLVIHKPWKFGGN